MPSQVAFCSPCRASHSSHHPTPGPCDQQPHWPCRGVQGPGAGGFTGPLGLLQGRGVWSIERATACDAEVLKETSHKANIQNAPSAPRIAAYLGNKKAGTHVCHILGVTLCSVASVTVLVKLPSRCIYLQFILFLLPKSICTYNEDSSTAGVGK